MNKGLYGKLALQNIKKNKNTFLPFSLSCTAMVALFYMLSSIKEQAGENLFVGAGTMQLILQFGVVVCGVFSLFVIFYTNSFLLKRRSKEFGLYSILGMEKRHIGKVVFWEIAITGIFSIAAGIIAGILFSKLMFMVLLKLLYLKTDFAFAILPQSIFLTIILFVGVFVLNMVFNNIHVQRLKPMELMNSSRVGEREPKAKWILALLGIICLGIGYYLAISTDDPIQALSVFFVAVLLVIAGTYLVFMSGSIALLQLLKMNRKYYYQKNHFITVSGLMYRMKQNALGLANICILSTGVLVVVSTTISLYVGMDDVLRTRYPKDVATNYLYEKDTGNDPEDFQDSYDYSIIEEPLQERASQYHVTITDVEKGFYYYSVGTLIENQFTLTHEFLDNLTILDIKTLDQYQQMSGKSIKLENNEVLIYTSKGREISEDSLKITDLEYQIKGSIEEDHIKRSEYASSYGEIGIVVSDMEQMMKIRDAINANMTGDGYTCIFYKYEFDLEGELTDKEAFCLNLRDAINDTGIAHLATVENIFTVRQEFFGIYGSLFFIGIFIGTLFLITTVLIIYYKQISEGYEDKERFVIMQKVGMSNREVKSAIRSQILQVFFLPICLAIVHICFAFDIIRKILRMLNLSNATLFVWCTIATVAVFFAVYGIVYHLTAKAYYRIINQS